LTPSPARLRARGNLVRSTGRIGNIYIAFFFAHARILDSALRCEPFEFGTQLAPSSLEVGVDATGV